MRRFDPHTNQRKRAIMSRILNPGQFKLAELSQQIEIWEEAVRQYENRASTPENPVKLPEDIKEGVITDMCPEILKTHLQLNASKFEDYAAIRDEIMVFLEAKHAQGDAKATPMDIGAVGNGQQGCFVCGGNHYARECPKGKGKQKGYKGWNYFGDPSKGKPKG